MSCHTLPQVAPPLPFSQPCTTHSRTTPIRIHYIAPLPDYLTRDTHGTNGLDLERAAAAWTMAEFDDAAIAPMMGCHTALEYYRQASARNGTSFSG